MISLGFIFLISIAFFLIAAFFCFHRVNPPIIGLNFGFVLNLPILYFFNLVVILVFLFPWFERSKNNFFLIFFFIKKKKKRRNLNLHRILIF